MLPLTSPLCAGWPSFLSKGAAPTTNRALFGAAGSSCEAPLKFLAPRLHLVSFATADDLAMLRHFVAHYTRLGLAPAHMLVFVFAAAGSGGDALVQALHAHGATQSRLMTERYNDSYKLELINAHLASLPDDAWAMTPDVDERAPPPVALARAQPPPTSRPVVRVRQSTTTLAPACPNSSRAAPT